MLSPQARVLPSQSHHTYAILFHGFYKTPIPQFKIPRPPGPSDQMSSPLHGCLRHLKLFSPAIDGCVWVPRRQAQARTDDFAWPAALCRVVPMAVGLIKKSPCMLSKS